MSHPDKIAHDFFVLVRWPNGVQCCHCQSTNIGGLVEGHERRKVKRGWRWRARRLWNCKSCKKQFTVKTGTFMQDSAIPLSVWLKAIMAYTENPKMSARAMAKHLDVTLNSAFRIRDRLGMKQKGDAPRPAPKIRGGQIKLWATSAPWNYLLDPILWATKLE
jgi:transposase-like protein